MKWLGEEEDARDPLDQSTPPKGVYSRRPADEISEEAYLEALEAEKKRRWRARRRQRQRIKAVLPQLPGRNARMGGGRIYHSSPSCDVPRGGNNPVSAQAQGLALAHGAGA